MDRSKQYQPEPFDSQLGDSLNGYPVHHAPAVSDENNGTFPHVEDELPRLNTTNPLDEASLLLLNDAFPAELAERSEIPSLNAAAERQNIDEAVDAILQSALHCVPCPA